MNSDDTAQASVQHQKTLWASIKEWVRVIVIALIIAIPIRYFIAEPFIVNGASMDPTFSTGQFLIVDRLSYRFEEPKRGDVIVFKYPYASQALGGSSSVYYIKRIIGLPGERVRMQDGKITIEEASTTRSFVLNEPYVQSYHLSHDTTVFPENGKPLGPTEYFVMGDNRAESSDSRAWGPLDYQYITGRPLVRLTPLTAISLFPGEFHEATSTQQ
jgi:signal peptidase I